MTIALITGATGNVGRPLVTLLLDAGVRVRALTRDPEHCGLPADVEVVTSTAAGLAGADVVFLNSRALGDDLAAAVAGARSHGVTKLVALSAINADDDFSLQPSRMRGDRNTEAEQLAVESGMQWVSLRPTVFASNVAGEWGAQIQVGDVVRGPYALASTAPIVERDIAAVAAHAILTDGLNGRRIPLTGPQSFTNTELVELIGTVLNRPLRYQEVTPHDVRQHFIRLGFPTAFADTYIAYLAATVDQPAVVSTAVPTILGRPAEPFATWLTEHRDLFAGEHHTERRGNR
ncbi:MAG: NAD(P)H-binding protein [Mycobacterium sp.]